MTDRYGAGARQRCAANAATISSIAARMRAVWRRSRCVTSQTSYGDCRMRSGQMRVSPSRSPMWTGISPTPRPARSAARIIRFEFVRVTMRPPSIGSPARVGLRLASMYGW